MTLSRIVMRLARNPGTEFADGDDHRGYTLVAPLTEDGMIDEAAFRAVKGDCTVRRFAPDEDPQEGRLARRGVLAFAVAHPHRTGSLPASPRTRTEVTLPDGTTGSFQHWDIEPGAWVRALNQAGLPVTSTQGLFAPADPSTDQPLRLVISSDS